MRSSFLLVLLLLVTPALAHEYSFGEWGLSGSGIVELPGFKHKAFFRGFDDRDGVPNSIVRRIAIDARGYVWIGTNEGPAYYNGRRWIAVNLPNRNRANSVFGVVPAQDGSIWFGTYGGGVIRLLRNSWTVYDSAGGFLPDDRVISMLAVKADDGSEEIWVGTENGIARYRENTWISFHDTPHVSTYSPSYIVQGRGPQNAPAIWMSNRTGLLCYEQGRWILFNSQNSPFKQEEILGIASTTINGRSRLWLFTQSGLFGYEDGKWQTLNPTQLGLPEGLRIYALEVVCQQSKDVLWVRTERGIASYDSKGWTFYDSNLTLGAGVRPLCLLATMNNGKLSSIWVGSYGAGVHHHQNNAWTPIRVAEMLPDRVRDILQVDDKVLVAYVNGAVHNYSKKAISKSIGLGSKYGFVSTMLHTISEEGEPGIWIGTNMSGLYRYTKTMTKFDPEGQILPSKRVICVKEFVETDGSHTLWIGTDKGLVRYRKDGWQVFTRQNSGLPESAVLSILRTTARGRSIVIAGTDRGMAIYDKDRWTAITPENSSIPDDQVSCFTETKEHTGKIKIWAGTLSGGVFSFYPEDPFRLIETFSETTSPALPSNSVRDILADKDGYLYILTNMGMALASPGKGGGYSLRAYGIQDGMPSSETNLGRFLADGSLLVSTSRGLAIYDRRREYNPTPSSLYIELMEVDGVLKDPSVYYTLAHNENNFTFEYALLSYFREQDIRYRIQLRGYDPAPSDWTAKFRKEYTNLPNGDYELQVWGRDYVGNVTGPLSVKFTITPAPWHTWWAYAGYILLSGGSIYSGVRWRIRRVQKRNKQLEQIVAERTSEVVQQKESILDSIRYAERIQHAILPVSEQLEAAFHSYFVLYRPKDIVSGDFYWFHQVNGWTFLAVVDCTGHGVPGALMSMIGNDLLNQIVIERRIYSPAKILEQLHLSIRRVLKQAESDARVNDGMDVALCRFDRNLTQLVYAGAGRPLYYIDTSFQEIQGRRYSLGGRRVERVFTEVEIAVEKPVTIYLTTDGFADQQNPQGRKYGSKRLKRLLESYAHLSMKQQQLLLTAELDSHQGQELQRDDITILGIRVA